MNAELKDKAEDVAESPWTKRLARAGLVAKGITFGIVAAIALKVAIAGGGKIEDRPGALHDLAHSAFGKILLAALAVGLAGYAFWRFAQALLGRELETGEREGALKRIGLVARGALYSWLAFLCAELVIDTNAAGGGKKKEDDVTARVLDLPLGRWLVAGAGLAVMGAGAYNVYRGLSGKFRKHLKEEQMGGHERRYALFCLVQARYRELLSTTSGAFAGFGQTVRLSQWLDPSSFPPPARRSESSAAAWAPTKRPSSARSRSRPRWSGPGSSPGRSST